MSQTLPNTALALLSFAVTTPSSSLVVTCYKLAPATPGSQLDVDPMVTWISLPSIISDLERRAHRTGQGCWTSLVNFCLIAVGLSLALVCGSHMTDALYLSNLPDSFWIPSFSAYHGCAGISNSFSVS